MSAVAQPPPKLEDCHLLWNSPSASSAGSMPIGNGELGANVWMTPDGVLHLLLARTDAWSEACRLLKLGQVDVSFDPPLQTAAGFRQVLALRDGQIQFQVADVSLRVFVDSGQPVLHIVGESKSPRKLRAKAIIWRTESRTLTGTEADSAWTMRQGPHPITEAADQVRQVEGGIHVWHRNGTSIVPLSLQHQGLAEAATTVRDPLLHRSFGFRLASPGSVIEGKTGLAGGHRSSFALRISTASFVDSDPEAIHQRLQASERLSPAITAEKRATAWWRDFWSRSYVLPGIGSDPRLAPAYQLQRWVMACGGRGQAPIKFNGSIFTVEPTPLGQPFNADWRRWGDCFWWQNTRLPYNAMLAGGDADLMESLFRTYEAAVPLAEARSRIYHGVKGSYFPETMTIFGAYSNNDYGWNRAGHQANEVLCPWWQWVWVQGLELLNLMDDRYRYTGDSTFARRRLLPMARSVLAYFETRFPRTADGKLRLTPTQSVETYWFDVINDTPTVAGLHDVLARLLALPETILTPADRKRFEALQAALPPVPLHIRAHRQVIAPAESYKDQRNNVENPEFYAIWPFRQYGIGRPGLHIGQNTFHRRIERSQAGWQYDGQTAAYLGLTSEASASLRAKLGNSNPAYRFPASWGPNYDWLPDQCHGSNILITTQTMLLQADGERIYLLPAWPREWDVSFRLHAPAQTVIEGTWRAGKWERMVVTPASRRKDIVDCSDPAVRLRLGLETVD